MEDIYSAIVGEPPSEQEKLSVLARKLRDRQQLGQILALAGDKTVAPLGGRMSELTQDQAEKIANRQIVRSQLQNSLDLGEQRRRAALEEAAKQNEYGIADREDTQAFEAEQNRLQREHASALEKARRMEDDDKAKKDLNKYVRYFGQERQKLGLPEIESTIEGLDELVEKYRGGDLPGTGQLGHMSKGAAAQEFQIMRQRLVNAVTKARSGLAVTEGEAERILTELGLSKWAGDEHFLRAYGDFKDGISRTRANVHASYDPEVIEEYQRRYNPSKALSPEQINQLSGGGSPAAAAPDAQFEDVETGVLSPEAWQAQKNKGKTK